MASTSEYSGPNDWLIEEIHQQYLANPRSVSAEWRATFEGTAPPITTAVANGNGEAVADGANTVGSKASRSKSLIGL